ncbi:attractin-like protein 1 isoform X1 [Hydractinia symbiolongicarpus]|uniref:attractin-like protein 1 isoform X1 n=1 Tax=Hydractinia symbiolongicarpus TaxID=13093 RepID=UPI002550524C|nr:attractin-like protein 1 isoform X1 [Hydractinia symbiolongicarpus]
MEASAIVLIIILICFRNVFACQTDSKSCSGISSFWNPNSSSCSCPSNLWGTFCQFGRTRFTSKTGFIFDSQDNYHCASKYMYLIDSQRKNVPIQIYVHNFATECLWDHLYIYDGVSIYDPLIAAFSGVVVNKGDPMKTVTAYSGAAYLYFYSDANMNDRGFNISYRISECSAEACNYHGICKEHNVCECESGWTGTRCQQKLCCNETFNLYGSALKKCTNCKNKTLAGLKIGRSSHAAVLSSHKMYIYGGYSTSNLTTMLTYSIESKKWDSEIGVTFENRYGHTMVAYGTFFYLFGGTLPSGTITNQLKRFHEPTKTWKDLTSNSVIPVTGHASVVAEGKMYVFFGFNEEDLVVNLIQQYDFGTKEWSIVSTKEYVPGRFGHSATYDIKENVVYVFGGFFDKNITSQLLIFDVAAQSWRTSPQSDSPRMLHSAVIVGRSLIIYGGNAHDASTVGNTKRKCYSEEVQIYNIDCKKWIWSSIRNSIYAKGRYGHTGIAVNGSMFIFGGFDGTLRKDVFEVKISGNCNNYTDKTACLMAPVTYGCTWSKTSKKENTCMGFASRYLAKTSIEKPLCNASDTPCKNYKTEANCPELACIWKDGNCVNKEQRNPKTLVRSCNQLKNCVSCNQNKSCHWKESCQDWKGENKTSCFGDKNITSCHDFQTCTSCIAAPGTQCMWCNSTSTCISVSSYVIEFPYGQCLEWISGKVGVCKATRCELQTTCQKCFKHPGCGWCDDGTNTGIGRCMAGTDSHPIGNSTCPTEHWSFTECPACHCNGHSTCFNGTNECIKCFGNVEGKHCEMCIKGYYGDPTNNGTCKECQCNGHTKACTEKGECTCNMRGAIGTHCEKCDSSKNFQGNSTNGGMCYSRLSVDFQYTTNLTRTIIAGFTGKPRSQKKDFRFEIIKVAGGTAYLNLTIHYANGKFTSVRRATTIENIQVNLDEDSYVYDSAAELRAIVYGWQEDEYFSFKISYSHPPPEFDLVYFLIMFLIVFCSLLIVLIVLWKIKQRYDIYRHSRRQRQEHQERISRPFKSFTVLLPDKSSLFEKVQPNPVACENLANEQLAIVSFIMQLPTDEHGCTPSGQSGLCIGSVLTTTHRRRTFSIQHSHGNNKRKNKTRSVLV